MSTTRGFNRYLDAFYHGYSRRPGARGRDRVHYFYSDDARVTTWTYAGRLIAALVISQDYCYRYFLLRPPGIKGKKAVSRRLVALVDRYAGDFQFKGATPAAPEGAFARGQSLHYSAGQKPGRDISISQRIKSIWKS